MPSSNSQPYAHAPATTALLAYTERNSDSQKSVLFIHGSRTTGLSWDKVSSNLPAYHCILPDLPCHGASAEFHPTFTVSDTVELLANLIQSVARNGRAYIVAHSLGAHIAVHLLATYPELIEEAAFVSGYCVMPQYRASTVARFFWLESLIPDFLVNAVGGLDDIPRSRSMPKDWDQTVAKIMTTKNWPIPWSTRTLLFVAGKGGLIPSNDPIDCNLQLRDIGRKGNPETIAVTHHAMRHPWCATHPELFAKCVKAWFEQGSIPHGAVVL